MHVRSSIKAIITQNNQVLFIKKKDRNGFYYLLPGGGQEHGEAIPDALKRECQEEVMVDVEVGQLLFVRDYIGKNHGPKGAHDDFHQIELMFDCTIIGNQTPQNGSSPDSGQVGVEWINLNEIQNYRIFPDLLKQRLRSDNTATNIYLGDVN